MKFNVKKMTSITLLTSMMLTTVSPLTMPAMALEMETENTAEEISTEEIVTQLSENQDESQTEKIEQDNQMLMETETIEENVSDDISEEILDNEHESTENEENIAKSEMFSVESDTDATETDVIPEVTESESQEVQVFDPIKVELDMVGLENDEGKFETREQGSFQKFQVSAVNPTDEDVELRLYFWDYAGEEMDGKKIKKEILTDVCEDFKLPDFGESPYYSTFLVGAGQEQINAEYIIQNEMKDNVLTARYLTVNLFAGCTLEDTILITDDLAENIVVSPIVCQMDEELEFDKLVIQWNEKEMVQEVETEVETGSTDKLGDETKEDLLETDFEEEVVETEVSSTVTGEEVTNLSEQEDVYVEIPEYLKEQDFSSKRLIVLAGDSEMIRESDHVIESYGDIFLIEYETTEACMEAYVYYLDVAEVDAVEPDVYMEVASDETEEKNEESDKSTALSNLEGASFVSDGKERVIALLDTGASASANVIERVSLIDNVLEGHTHGNDMVEAIVSQNPDAKILSVRVMGNDGRGTVSSILAGMEYAIENGASIINLSLSSKKNALNAVLEAEIQKAVSMGIIVVGAAGNRADDVMEYMPGSVEEAFIIGACNKHGVRISTSNYGSTVDYNVIAGTTSEAAAKFSGCVSLAGVEGLKINDGAIYAADYVVVEPDEKEDVEDTEMPEIADDQLTEEEKEDMAGTEEEGEYPGIGSSISKTIRIWSRDTEYDISTYNPYPDDENVIVSCNSELSADTNGKRVQAAYVCSLKENENYKWNLFVTFEYVDDRSLATEGSNLLENLMPEIVNQDRNAGYGGIVPGYTGTTVAGREFTVIKDDQDFDIYGLLIDYNPETFKVNDLADDGGFDVSVPGTYTVTYEMSYFLYPEYTWFLANKVKVVEKESLEPGIYLTSIESTLMFRKNDESHFCGYGDLVKVEIPEESYTIRCIDSTYEVDFSSSSEMVTPDICVLTEENGNKNLTILVPENLNEAVILSMYRPGYQAAKFFTGGGWADGEEFNLEEASIDELTAEEVGHLEETVLGKVEEDEEGYMEIAASWTTVESKNIRGRVTTGESNTMNNSWLWGRTGGCNYGTAQVDEKKAEISSWIGEKGYEIDSSDLKNFKVSCSSGHDYLGLWPNSSYDVTLKCYIQKKGDNLRLKITCSLKPGSDDHGTYQSFYGSKTYSNVMHGARLRVYKRFSNPRFMEENPDKYGTLRTTFSIYPASAYNETTKMIDTTVDPESTIILSDDEDYSVYGDSDILDPGTYYVVESRRIKGCTQNTDIYGPVVINETDSGVIKLHERVNNEDYASMGSNNWIYNYPMYFNGKILTKTDDSGLPVEGAIYKVEYSNASSAADFAAVKTWYLQTDEKGNLAYNFDYYVSSFTYKGKTYKSDELITNTSGTVAMLPFGFLRIVEIMPPSEVYELDTNIYTIELVAKKDAAGAYTIRKLVVKGNIPVSVDKLRYWKLKVKKESQASEDVLELGAYSLSGATFAVYSDKACTKRVALYLDEKLTKKVPDNVFTTDEEGNTATYYLKAGTGETVYYVKELKAPAGHKLLEEVVVVTVNMPDDAVKVKTAHFAGEFSEPYDYMEVEALVQKLSMYGNPVQNVVFKVCFYDDNTANAGKLKKTWYLVSDKEGKISMDQSHVYDGDKSMKSDSFYKDPSTKKVIIPTGGYLTIQEVQAPAQYELDDTVHGFSTKTKKFVMQRLYNDMHPCRIRLKKYDQTGKKTLEGVQFELKFVKANEQVASLKKDYNRLLKEGETKILASDKKGEVIFDNLEQGIYEITEVKTVAGQMLLKEKITVELPITMTKEEADSYGNVDFSNAIKDKGYTDKWFIYDCLYEITNEPQFRLPQTGASGIWILGYAGVMMLTTAGGVLFVGKRKRRNLIK